MDSKRPWEAPNVGCHGRGDRGFESLFIIGVGVLLCAALSLKAYQVHNTKCDNSEIGIKAN